MTDGSSMYLRDICDLVTEQVDPRDRPDAIYVGLEHVRSGRFVRSGEGAASSVRSAKYAFASGDILYGKLRPYLDKAVLSRDEGICTTELLVLRPKKGVDPRFVAGVVHSPAFVEHAVAGTTGVQHPRTSWSHISNFSIPSLNAREQAKIAGMLWQIHDAVTTNEAVIEAATTLKRSAMREIFTRGLRGEPQKETEIGLVPESWAIEPINEHFSVISGGTPSRRTPMFWTGGTIPWVKTTEINYCVIQETEEHITQAGLDRSAAKLFPPETLLLAMYGQGVTRGRVAILGIEAACNQACAAINPHDDAMVDTQYIYHFLAFHYEAIRRLAHGGQQQNLNLDIVRSFPIAYPASQDEQRGIVAILDAIDQKIDLHRRKLAVLDDLFMALLHKLMTGEIRVAALDLAVLAEVRFDSAVFSKLNVNEPKAHL